MKKNFKKLQNKTVTNDRGSFQKRMNCWTGWNWLMAYWILGKLKVGGNITWGCIYFKMLNVSHGSEISFSLKMGVSPYPSPGAADKKLTMKTHKEQTLSLAQQCPSALLVDQPSEEAGWPMPRQQHPAAPWVWLEYQEGEACKTL